MRSDDREEGHVDDVDPSELLERVSALPVACRDEPAVARALVQQALARLSAAGLARVEDTAARSSRLGRLRVEIGRMIQAIDETLSRGLAAVLGAPDFRRLEASWRGLHYLCSVPHEQSESKRKIQLIEITWRELVDDLDQPSDLETSRLFWLLHDDRLDMPNGEPIGLLLVDFEFGIGCRKNSVLRDIEALRALSSIGERTLCPVVANASPSLVFRETWTDLTPGVLPGVIEDRRLIHYRSLRESSSSRFLILALPRILARAEWTSERVRESAFRFDERAAHGADDTDGQTSVAEEGGSEGDGVSRGVDEGGESKEFGPLWCGAAFGFAAAALQCFDRTGWFADLRGADVSDGRFEHRGGMVPAPDTAQFAAALPAPRTSLPADLRYFDESCAPSVECVLEESVEHELQAVGLLPVSRSRFTRSLAFHGIRSVHRPADHSDPGDRADARMGALIPHTLCACRIAHYVTRMFRDKIGSTIGAERIQQDLESWLSKLVDPSDDIDPRRLGEMPLRERSVDVQLCGPGAYECVIRVEPRIQFETVRGSVVLPPVRFGGS